MKEASLSLTPFRVNEQLEALAATANPDLPGHTRLALTDHDRLGRDFVVTWMKRIGLDVQIDVVGNIFGTLPGLSGDDPIMIGSHIDTVEQGGRFDGCYGVIGALAVAERLAEAGTVLPRSLVVAVFTNEEGVRYQPDLMGSRVFTGELEAAEALQSSDLDGVTVAEALRGIGQDGAGPYRGAPPGNYVELHIEQGPVLEAEGVQIGVVTGIAGFCWLSLGFTGQADHAGSTPMRLRKDAGQGAMALAAAADLMAQEDRTGLVVTAGSMRLQPGDINVVPGRAELTLDVRGPDQHALDAARERIIELGHGIARERGLVFSWEVVSESPVVEMDQQVVDTVARVADDLGYSAMRMLSGAAHDAQSLSRICPTGMIFVPSVGGRSHSPDEYTAPEDLDRGAEVLLQTVLRLNRQD